MPLRPAASPRRLSALVAACAAVTALLGGPGARALDANRLITQYVRDAWTTKTGLPSQTVWSIAQTKKGYLWLGTSNGLARFDGEKFTVFDGRNTPALRSNDIRSLLPGRHGGLWLGTYGGGAVRYRDGHFTAYTKKNGLPSNVVYEVYRDHSGGLWFATANGVSHLQHGHFTNLTKKDGLPRGRVYRIIQDGDAMWFATLTGGLVRDRGGKLTTFTKKDGLGSNQIHSLFVTKGGTLVIGTYGGGLYRYQQGKFIPFGLPKGFGAEGVETMVQDPQGNLWIGTYGGGLIRDHDGHFSRLTASDGLSDNFVFALHIDREGDLWAGTRSGLNRLSNGKVLVYGKPEGLANTTFDVFQAPDGTVWVGTEGHGLYGIRNGHVTRHITRAQGLASNNITSIASDGNGGLWIGTFGAGLSHIQGQKIATLTKKDGLGSDFVFALYRTAKGALWAATNAGLTRFSGGSAQTFSQKDGLPAAAIRVIYQDRSGQLWFGTNGGGLLRYDQGKFHALTTADGLPSNLVYALRSTPGGNLWIGTRGGGLALYRDGHLFSFNKQPALSRISIFGILADNQGNLWLSTPDGLLRASIKQLLAVAAGKRSQLSVTHLDETDGMRSSQFNGGFEPSAWKAQNGTLWFPSHDGVVSVDPAKLRGSAYPPPVYIESVMADGKPVDLRHQPVKLPARSRNIEIHYTALDYAAPSRVRFRYRLKGLDANWIDAGNRRVAYYSHLPPGHFDFQVVAANSDGVWNRKGASFSMEHQPFFYQTWWFYAALTAMAGLMVFGGYRLRVGQLRRRQRELANLVRERTQQLEEALGNVERLTRVDVLTGLANRRGLEEALTREWERALRSGAPLSLLMVDIDRFKDLNDGYGHQRGDQCLQAVADELRTATRASADLVGRWGGEEFLVLLPETTGEAAGDIAERLRHQILDRKLEHARGGIGGMLTVSVGVATCRPGADMNSYEALIAAADDALYRAKHQGRNRVCGPEENRD